jgi:hypothetical protein
MRIHRLFAFAFALVASACSSDPEGLADASVRADARASDAARDRDSGAPLPRTDAGPIVERAACDALPGAGTWEEITPAVFRTQPSTETFAVTIDPYSQTVYSAACNNTARGGDEPQFSSGIYRSEDCGATWELVSTGESADRLQTGCAWALLAAPRPDAEPTLYVQNGYGNDPTIYRSRDGGVNFEALDADPENTTGDGFPFVHAIALGTYDDAHVAVAFHLACEAPRNGLCFSRSLDGGDTWQLFDGPRSVDSWEEGASIRVLGPTQYLYSGASGSWYTADEGATDWMRVSETASYCCYGGSSFLDEHGDLFAPIGPSEAGIHRSRAGASVGAVWEPLPGSPNNVVAMVSDGERLYAGRLGFDRQRFYFSAPLDDLTSWTQLELETTRGPNQMAYDPVHHVVYSANYGAGLWRFVSR